MDDFVSNSNLIVQRDFSFLRKIPHRIEDYVHVWHTATRVIICIQMTVTLKITDWETRGRSLSEDRKIPL